EWLSGLSEKDGKYFRIEAKTVLHLGEVAYLEKSNPVSLAVNQVFKIEKLFSAGELGATDIVKRAAAAELKTLGLKPKFHKKVLLPEESEQTKTWILSRMPLSK